MAGNPVPPSRDLHGGTAKIRPPPPERRLEWCGSGYGVEKWRSAPGEEGRLDPGVCLLAGATGAKYKSMSPAKLPITRVPCLTIPPGFSPSALLESPVLLTNMKAEPSPTTGKVNMAYIEDKTVCSDTLSSLSDSSNINTYSKSYSRDFEFRPHVGESYRAGLSSLRPLVFPIQGLLQGEQESSLLIQCQSQGQNKVAFENESTLLVSAPILATEVSNSRDCLQPETASDVLPQRKGSDDDTQTFQSDFSQPTPSSILEKSAEDGFNWRKYGQKHVKGSEFPRSYYKCTHPNCEMRKLMERSHDGKITGITYKGHHDHPKPQSTRASAVGAIFTSQDAEKTDSFLPLVSVEDESEIVPSHISHHADRNNNTELSPTLISDKDVEIGGGQSSNCDDVGEDGDPESKRRKMELIMNDTSSIGKMNREPRVVVQTISEVDILDDGYRWRKYGQKVVKGNPNPRSYYKCTTAGCPVRKHVERASHDPKAVITTYEGKHNHDVPASKTTGHEASASMAADGDSSQATHSSPALSGTMRSIPHSFTQMESDTISLDLGVGISPNQNNVTYGKPHSGEKEQIQHNQPQSIDCGQLVIQAVPLSGFHETSRTRAHGIGEIKSAGFEFRVSPIDDPANMYFTTSENLVMGP